NFIHYILRGLLGWKHVLLLPGVKCKQNGEWILGYNHYLGSISIFEAEICGYLMVFPFFRKRGTRMCRYTWIAWNSLKFCRLATWLVCPQS
ncbi:hypothetical protein Goari_009605, partial [Gossypium aridum]|nr:hypothetical protein [Gossypium aridum]